MKRCIPVSDQTLVQLNRNHVDVADYDHSLSSVSTVASHVTKSNESWMLVRRLSATEIAGLVSEQQDLCWLYEHATARVCLEVHAGDLSNDRRLWNRAGAAQALCFQSHLTIVSSRFT